MKTSLFFLTVVACAVAQERPVETFNRSASDVKITPVRHASIMIEAGGKVIHIDPWSEGNYNRLPAADLILITDIHGDHMDPKAIAKVTKADTKVIAPEAVKKTVTQASALSNGDKTEWEGWTIEAVPMYNIKRG